MVAGSASRVTVTSAVPPAGTVTCAGLTVIDASPAVVDARYDVA